MRTKSKIIGAAAIVAALAAGGSAFTNSNTLPAAVTVGYGTQSISGATATDISYALSADGKTIVSETITFTGDLSGAAVTVNTGWNGGALTECDGDKTNATYDGVANTTTMTCTDNEATTTGTEFDVAVTH
ncbi:MAG TPA: hypothetical protein VN738_05300 [Acidothermaceae bacterium]|jgi:hypothetical protein|nr:hypothetical protein [Acidothermaceae bacterium]